jgi:hypothetical protein
VSEPGDQAEDPVAVAELRRRLQAADEAISVPVDLHRRLQASRPKQADRSETLSEKGRRSRGGGDAATSGDLV